MPRKPGVNGRNKDTRLPLKTVFIVTEGKETERIYFRRFRKRGTNVKIVFPDPGKTDPKGIVKFAERLVRNQLVTNDFSFDPGDEVWCVFDVDGTNNTILAQAKAIADRRGIKIVLSNPSFEVWFLIHFQNTKRALTNSQTINELKKYISNYHKSMDVYDLLIDKQHYAISNAQSLVAYHQSKHVNIMSIESNPSTMVHELIEYLNNM